MFLFSGYGLDSVVQGTVCRLRKCDYELWNSVKAGTSSEPRTTVNRRAEDSPIIA